jgi:hypothetical protein
MASDKKESDFGVESLPFLALDQVSSWRNTFTRHKEID